MSDIHDGKPYGCASAPWPVEKDRAFTKMWMDGIALKKICLELDIPMDEFGRSGSAVHARKRLNLPPRRSQIQKEPGAARQIRVPDAIWDALHSRALERGCSIAAYVRYLIRRDLGISAEKDYRPMPKGNL